MNIAYMIYQAERQPSAAEQRAADIRRGELARALAQLVRRNPSGGASTRGGSAGGTRRCPAEPELAHGRRQTTPDLARC